jgi:sulfur carrier protein ThiS
MKVILRHPRREIEVPGPRRVHALLADLSLVPEAHLVICDDTLVPSDALLPDDAVVEIRPVISGGA